MILSPRNSSAQAYIGIVSLCVLKRKISQNLTNVYSFLKLRSIWYTWYENQNTWFIKFKYDISVQDKMSFLASHLAKL